MVTYLLKINDFSLGNKSHGIYNDLWKTIVGIVQFYLIIFNNVTPLCLVAFQIIIII